MGKGISKLGIITAAAGGLLFLYVRQRAAETGRDIPSVIANLPDELRESWAQWRSRAMVALEAGREAAEKKEEDIEEDLAGTEVSVNATTDYPI